MPKVPSLISKLLLLAMSTALAPACLEPQSGVETSVHRQRAEPSVKPGINEPFLSPDLDPQEWVERFEGESREIYQSRTEVVQALGLEQGTRIADIGAGTGFFTLLFAGEVDPEGWVYAVEIAPAFVHRISNLADRQGVVNVTPLLGAVDHIRLPPESVDMVFICDTYHHFEYPESTMASIRQALRPEGRLVIIDFERIPGVSRDWVLDHVRAGKTQVRDEIESAGFDFLGEKQIEGLKENYFIEFRKSEEG